MALAEASLEIRARRAYELGRGMLGARLAAVVLPMIALSLFACERPAATFGVGALLVPLVAFFAWRGGDMGRGARLGLAAGAAPLLVPILVRLTVHACGTALCPSYGAVCLGGGAVGGGLLGLWVVRRGLATTGVLSAGVVAVLAGTLGCLVAGVAGLVGLVGGFGLGAAPSLALRRT